VTGRDRLQLARARYQWALSLPTWPPSIRATRTDRIAVAAYELDNAEAEADLEDAPEYPHPDAPIKEQQ